MYAKRKNMHQAELAVEIVAAMKSMWGGRHEDAKIDDNMYSGKDKRVWTHSCVWMRVEHKNGMVQQLTV